MEMNLPNKLTIMRVVLIPVFLVVLFLMQEPYNRYIATGIFVVASITDFLDGHIARQFWKVYGPIGRQIVGDGSIGFYGCDGRFACMGGDCDIGT